MTYVTAILLDDRVVLRVYDGDRLIVDAPISSRRAVILANDLLNAALAASAAGDDALEIEASGESGIARIHNTECKCKCAAEQAVPYGKARWGPGPQKLA